MLPKSNAILDASVNLMDPYEHFMWLLLAKLNELTSPVWPEESNSIQDLAAKGWLGKGEVL